MSWNLTVKNNYREAIKAFNTIVNQNETMTIAKTLGSGYIDVFGAGTVNFTDIGDQHVGGFSKATWGVLIAYQGEEIIFRYEGGGKIDVTINKYGQAEISGNGSFSRINIGGIVLKGEHAGI